MRIVNVFKKRGLAVAVEGTVVYRTKHFFGTLIRGNGYFGPTGNVMTSGSEVPSLPIMWYLWYRDIDQGWRRCLVKMYDVRDAVSALSLATNVRVRVELEKSGRVTIS